MSLQPVSAAFMPLTDSAILIAAATLGFAEKEGIAINLTRETSWANVRDRMAVGHFDVAHMLAPMPIAFNLGLSPLSLKVIAPMALGLGGNAITVSLNLYGLLQKIHKTNALQPETVGSALKAVIESGKKSKTRKLTFAVVHPHSVHNFELRYWLAACGVNPEQDIEIVVVPPPLMPDALSSGQIDGFCVGEPWNSIAVQNGSGVIATVKAAIWKSSPEKVLGVSEVWADKNPDTLAALLRALHLAAKWCGEKQNHIELAQLLAKPAFLNQPANLLDATLSGQFIAQNGSSITVDDFFVPFARAANFPWQSHALWLYSQMVRWGHVKHLAANADVSLKSYRPDIYRAALKPLNVALPGANSKVEGALTAATPVGASAEGLVLGPDGFFDGTVFDPALLDLYIANQRAQF